MTRLATRPRRVRRLCLALACPAALLLTGAARRAGADGPHWYIPEPPAYDALLLDGDKETLSRYATAMHGVSRFQPNRPANPNARIELIEIARVCVRYLREYDTYSAAPDSPAPWRSQEGREKMAEYAVATLRMLASRAQVAQFVVEAFADQVRLDETLRQNKALGVNECLAAFTTLGEKMERYEAALLRLIEIPRELVAARGDPDRIRALNKEKAEQDAAIADYQAQRAKAVGLLNHWKNALPKTFQANVTGDIPFSQSDASDRLADALRKMGPPVAPFLRGLLNHQNPAVAKAAQQLLAAFEGPGAAAPAREEVFRHLYAYEDPQFQAGALAALRAYGLPVLPLLLDIARDPGFGPKKQALAVLAQLTGQTFGEDLEKWQAYVNARLGQRPAPAKKEANPKAAPADQKTGPKAAAPDQKDEPSSTPKPPPPEHE